MNNLALKTEKLSCWMDDRQILNNIDLEIKKGEFVGLIGPNGAGKTTLLKCITKLLPVEGSVLLQGENTRKMGSRERAQKVALMSQNTVLTYPFPALDVVLMGRYAHLGRFQRETAKDIKLARDSMEYTDTLHLAEKPISEMSGGERQRVFFSKVMAQEAPLLLLDEPTASLDISHQHQILRYAAQVSMKGNTVIASIHDLRLAIRYCSRLILLHKGAILAEGSAEQVITQENLLEAFGVKTEVYTNTISGELDFHVYQ